LWVAACTGGYGPKPASGGGGTSSTGSIVSINVGLVSAVAGDASVLLEWIAKDANGNDLPVAVFSDVHVGTVYSGAPIAVDPAGSSLVVPNLANDVNHYFGLAIDDGGGTFTPTGAVLRARPNPPIYVKLGADPNIADGLTPDTAFPDPLFAIFTAASFAHANVWISGADYADQSLPLFPGIDVYGGFSPNLVLAERDRAAFPTKLHGKSPLNILSVNGAGAGVIVDGIVFEGDQKGVIGFESDDTDVQLRSCDVIAMKGRGLKLLSNFEDRTFEALIVNCRSLGNGADGLTVQGAVNVQIVASIFAGNGQEGVEFGNQVAPDGIPVFARFRGSQFLDNAFEGLKLQLSAPLAGGSLGSTFTVEAEGCTFQRNHKKAGLLIDIDFNNQIGWRGDFVVRGCYSSNNEGDGVQLQLDSTCTALIHGLLATSNGLDGLHASSQSTPSFAVASNCVLTGNHGWGLHAEGGQVPVEATHCILAGNDLGGMASDTVESSAASCATWLQANDWSNVRTHFVAASDDAGEAMFAIAPEEYLFVTAVNAPKLTLASLGSLAVGDPVELADDGEARAIDSIGPGTNVGLAPAALPSIVPTSLARFAAGASVGEDYHLAANSAAAGAGMSAPGGPPVDAGCYGSPVQGDPGVLEIEAQPLFRPASASVAFSKPLATSDSFDVAFAGGALDASSISAQSVRVLDANGQPLNAYFSAVAGPLHVDPPTGGWPASTAFVLELHAGLSSTAGQPLATPLAIALRTQ
jgi:hypothetical protein